MVLSDEKLYVEGVVVRAAAAAAAVVALLREEVEPAESWADGWRCRLADDDAQEGLRLLRLVRGCCCCSELSGRAGRCGACRCCFFGGGAGGWRRWRTLGFGGGGGGAGAMLVPGSSARAAVETGNLGGRAGWNKVGAAAAAAVACWRGGRCGITSGAG